jgi:hypothetical protein
MRRIVLIPLALFAASSFAQESIPAGTILPMQLNSTINSKKMRVGQAISARLMQDVPLPNGSRIRAGAKVLGRIVAVQAEKQGGAEVAFRFDTMVMGKRRLPITTNLRAMATMMDVEAAQLPALGPDRGTSDFYWTTEQIGGETVYHGGGAVTHGSYVVGKSVVDGVFARPSANGRCRGDASGDARPQALWVFSSDACGLYDLRDLTLAHAGRSPARRDHLAREKGRGEDTRGQRSAVAGPVAA